MNFNAFHHVSSRSTTLANLAIRNSQFAVRPVRPVKRTTGGFRTLRVSARRSAVQRADRSRFASASMATTRAPSSSKPRGPSCSGSERRHERCHGRWRRGDGRHRKETTAPMFHDLECLCWSVFLFASCGFNLGQMLPLVLPL